MLFKSALLLALVTLTFARPNPSSLKTIASAVGSKGSSIKSPSQKLAEKNSNSVASVIELPVQGVSQTENLSASNLQGQDTDLQYSQSIQSPVPSVVSNSVVAPVQVVQAVPETAQNSIPVVPVIVPEVVATAAQSAPVVKEEIVPQDAVAAVKDVPVIVPVEVEHKPAVVLESVVEAKSVEKPVVVEKVVQHNPIAPVVPVVSISEQPAVIPAENVAITHHSAPIPAVVDQSVEAKPVISEVPVSVPAFIVAKPVEIISESKPVINEAPIVPATEVVNKPVVVESPVLPPVAEVVNKPVISEVPVSAPVIGLFSRITFREPVFLGGTGNITGLAKRLPVSDGMTGCIRKFVANEHEYVFAAAPSGDVVQGFDIQECIIDRCGRFPCRHGGKCLPSDQGAICLCPLGFGGDLCEIRLDLQVPLFNGSSYLRFAPLGDSVLIWLELKIIVKPQSENGLILYSGHHEYGDYISLSLNNGFVEFAFELGSGPAVVRSETALSMEQWHIIRISRTARLAVMKIDQLSEVMRVSPNGFWHLSLPHSLYLGGSNNAQYLPLNLKELGSFVGCIQKLEVNGRSIAIISEAVGGTNVDNCPHSCTSKPCGSLAQCVPNLESYECQCNPSNLQCNKAEELSVQQTRSSRTSFNFTGVSDSRSTIPTATAAVAANEKNALDSKLTMTTSVPVNSNSITASTASPTNLRKVDKTTTTATASSPLPTIPNEQRHKYNAEVVATLSLSDAKSPVVQSSDPYAKIDKTLNGDRSNGNSNSYENVESSTGMNSDMKESDDSDAYYYYYDDDDYKNDDPSSSSSDNIADTRATPTTKAAVAAAAVTTTASTSTVLPPITEQLTVKPMGISTDDDVTMVFGQYMAIDTDKLLKKEKLLRNKKVKNVHSKSIKPQQKKHYIPKPLLEPQSPSLADDEVEIDVILPPTQSKNDHLTTTTTVSAIDSENQSTVKDDSNNNNNNENHDGNEDGDGDSDGDADGDSDDDTDEMSGDFDVMGFYSNEDILTTKELIDDMARIMKNGAEIRRNQMNHKTKYVRKSHGACFTGADSYFHYNDAETMKQIISYKIDLNLRFKTHSHNGLILWTGRHTAQLDDDYLLLGIENGYNLGSGEVNIVYNTTKVSDGLWHRIRILRNLQDGSIEVDGGVEVSKRSPGKLRQLNTDTGLYVGGMPDIMYYTNRHYYSGIIGCISEIVLGGELKLSLDPETLGLAHNVEPGYF